jgi:hypothetical protein
VNAQKKRRPRQAASKIAALEIDISIGCLGESTSSVFADLVAQANKINITIR